MSGEKAKKRKATGFSPHMLLLIQAVGNYWTQTLFQVEKQQQSRPTKFLFPWKLDPSEKGNNEQENKHPKRWFQAKIRAQKEIDRVVQL